jgi:hypothetical protein
VVENGDLSPYIHEGALEKKFYSFKPTEDEASVVAKRTTMVNDVYNKDPIQSENDGASGVNGVNGVKAHT